MRKERNMVATTNQKARLLDLVTGILELVRDGKRNAGDVSNVLQVIKDERDFAKRLLGVPRSSQTLLEPIGTVAVPATTQPFVAKDKFVVNIGAESPVKILFLGSNFREWFLSKTEEPARQATLRYAKLMESSVDGPILAELGDKAETTLSQIYALMERQPNGKEGILLTNGWANIFYARDVNGSLRAVNVNWNSDGWNANASSVENPNKWNDGNRVFSRNCCILPLFYMAEVLFSTPFLQPPSIFPISFRCSEREIYFLLSIVFISHATCKKNLSASSFITPFLRQGNFSCFGR